MKSQGEIEAAVCDGISRFQQEFIGRGPKDIHSHLIGTLLVVRLQGVLTPAERQLIAGFGLPISRRRTFASALQAPAHSDLPALPALRHPWLRWSNTPASGTRGARSLLNESPRRKPRGCPGGETRRVFPSAHASGFQTGGEGLPLPLRRRM
jgi:hypothetical protein